VVHFSTRAHGKTLLRAISAVVITVSVAIRAAVFVATGLFPHAPLRQLRDLSSLRAD
jgi:ABC-type phosphate/phosphonate transport system permease subunit